MNRAATVAALLSAGALVLTACGSDNSTVTGDPTQTMAPPPSPTGTQTTAETPQGGQYPESPETVDTEAPGFDGPAVSARENGYLSALDQEGIETDELTEPLVEAGNTICRIRSTGGSAQETEVIANAVAGQVVAGGYADVEEEELAGLIIDMAAGQLCP